MSFWTPVAFAIVITGLAVTFLADLDRPSDIRAVRPESVSEVETGGLETRLRVLHAEARITQSQDKAWQTFVRSMLLLEEMTSDYRRRVAAGERADAAMETAQHTLMFGSAISDIEEKLSREQLSILLRQVDDLASNFTCKGLSRT